MVKLKSKSEMLPVLKTKRKLHTIDSSKHIFIDIHLTMVQRKQYKDIKRQLNKKKFGENSNGWTVHHVCQ